MRIWLPAVVCACAAFLATVPSDVFAETPKVSDACMLPPLKLPDEEVKAFIADPASLMRDIEKSREGRALALERRLRRMVGSDIATLDAVKTLLGTATAEEREAIGRALGAAALVCAISKPEVGLAIQAFVARLELPEVITAFLARSGDTSAASIAGVGPAGGIVVGSFAGSGMAPQSSAQTRAREVFGTPVASFGAANFVRPNGASASRTRP